MNISQDIIMNKKDEKESLNTIIANGKSQKSLPRFKELDIGRQTVEIRNLNRDNKEAIVYKESSVKTSRINNYLIDGYNVKLTKCKVFYDEPLIIEGVLMEDCEVNCNSFYAINDGIDEEYIRKYREGKKIITLVGLGAEMLALQMRIRYLSARKPLNEEELNKAFEEAIELYGRMK